MEKWHTASLVNKAPFKALRIKPCSDTVNVATNSRVRTGSHSVRPLNVARWDTAAATHLCHDHVTRRSNSLKLISSKENSPRPSLQQSPCTTSHPRYCNLANRMDVIPVGGKLGDPNTASRSKVVSCSLDADSRRVLSVETMDQQYGSSIKCSTRPR